MADQRVGLANLGLLTQGDTGAMRPQGGRADVPSLADGPASDVEETCLTIPAASPPADPATPVVTVRRARSPLEGATVLALFLNKIQQDMEALCDRCTR